jgi:Resolvase, N terminal domain
VLPQMYDDGGFSGGAMDRPALQRLLIDVAAGRIDVVVVYKVDRLTRSLSDFAKIVEIFDKRQVSFVSVTQAFNTTTSMGRLRLNVLLSFAQFEREVTGERIRDKIAASKKKGMWMGVDEPLWNDVQQILCANRVGRETGANATEPSLLAGLVFDAAGERLTPTHAVKKGTRYRYYISEKLITASAKDTTKGNASPPPVSTPSSETACESFS